MTRLSDRDAGEGEVFDIFVIGGGINGCGIARDAAGRGLKVALAEMGDLASATSSASTKLFHGGLRYLEYFEIKLVREALKEREVLLRMMPHISWPMRFVLPCHKDMRFDAETPVSRLLTLAMPWLRGQRPAWLIRLGLFFYDHLGGRKILPGTATLALDGTSEGAPLKSKFVRAYEYSDCWVQDARLVVLNARDAASRGARIMTLCKVTGATRDDRGWTVTTEGPDGVTKTHQARCLVNAAGPWVSEVLTGRLQLASKEHIRLVRGSHIVTRRLYDHDKCYFLQGSDGRIVFVIPYEDDFTLIGTTDREHADLYTRPTCTPGEVEYLCDFVSTYLDKPITPDDVVWSFSGVRPLYDDGASSATAATREYVLSLDCSAAPLLSVFGGKITTYRTLAESAMKKLAPFFPQAGGGWTATAPLPGGNFPVDGVDDLIARLIRKHPFLDWTWARRLVRTYGTEAEEILKGATTLGTLGQDFGASISARELDWAIANEWVRSAEDFLWRRTKLGLRLNAEAAASVDDYIRARVAGVAGQGDSAF